MFQFNDLIFKIISIISGAFPELGIRNLNLSSGLQSHYLKYFYNLVCSELCKMARTEKIHRELDKIRDLIERVKISLHDRAAQEDTTGIEKIVKQRDLKIELLESRVAILQESLGRVRTDLM